MLSFYEYLSWWVDEQENFWRHLSLTKPMANTEFTVIVEDGGMPEARLTLLNEKLTPARAESLNEALERIYKFNKVVMREPRHALGYMTNLFIAYYDYDSLKPSDISVLDETYIQDISILHTSTWTGNVKQEPLFRVDKLISFWKKHGEIFLRRIRVKEQTAFGFNQVPIDFFWIKESTLLKERSKQEIPRVQIVKSKALVNGKPQEKKNRFQKNGDIWTIVFDGVEVRPYKDAKGLWYIAYLLSRPGEVIEALNLRNAVFPGEPFESSAELSSMTDKQLEGYNLKKGNLNDGIPQIEPDEKDKLWRQYEELKEK